MGHLIRLLVRFLPPFLPSLSLSLVYFFNPSVFDWRMTKMRGDSLQDRVGYI